MSMTISECQTPRRPRPPPPTPSNVLAQFTLRSKVICITGASSGIGAAVAEAMAEAGGHLALWYNSNDAAISRGQELSSKHDVTVRAYKVQVSDPEEVKRALGKVVEDFGKVDVFVANAGMAISKPILEQSLEEYREQMAVNVDGVFYCAKFVGEIFQRQGFGNLIITSSISAHIVNVPVDQPVRIAKRFLSLPNSTGYPANMTQVYNATKAAVTHLGKSLAREWRDFARVNIVSPGFFNTKMGASDRVINEAYRMTPLGRQGDVKEIKGLYLYLASDASSYQTGSDVVIDGGYILP